MRSIGLFAAAVVEFDAQVDNGGEIDAVVDVDVERRGVCGRIVEIVAIVANSST
jgi:hypothetical protein